MLPVTFRYNDLQIKADYKIGAMDRVWEEGMQKAQQAGDFEGVIGSISDVTTGWSLEEEYVDDPEAVGFEDANGTYHEFKQPGFRITRPGEEGQARPIPLEPARLFEAKVPTYLIGSLIDAIQTDAAQGGAQAKKS